MLTTDRLLLRPFTMEDAGPLQRLAGAREVALNTLMIPHPYPDGAAEEWIRGQGERAEGNRTFAISLESTGELLGAIGLVVTPEHRRAELGYWIGTPYWNRGYASEAAAAVVSWAFNSLGMDRIVAMVFARNPASGRILAKIGMRREGLLRQHVIKWDERVDVEIWGILRTEWESRAGASRETKIPVP